MKKNVNKVISTTNNDIMTFSKVYDVFFENPKLIALGSTAREMFTLLHRRYQCSLQNAEKGNTTFKDEDGVFVIFSNDDLQYYMGIATPRPIIAAKRKLIEAGLITVKKGGLRFNLKQKYYINLDKLNEYAEVNVERKLIPNELLNSESDNNDDSNGSGKNSSFNYAKNTETYSEKLNNLNDMMKPTSQYNSLPQSIKEVAKELLGYVNYENAGFLLSKINETSEGLILHAIERLRNRKVTSVWSYLKATVKRYILNNVRTAEEAKIIDQEHNATVARQFEEQKAKRLRFGKKTVVVKEKLPDWAMNPALQVNNVTDQVKASEDQAKIDFLLRKTRSNQDKIQKELVQKEVVTKNEKVKLKGAAAMAKFFDTSGSNSPKLGSFSIEEVSLDGLL